MSQILLFDLQCLTARVLRRGRVWPKAGVNGRALELDADMQEVLEQLKETAPREIYERVKAVVESHDYVVERLREGSMKEDRLLELLCNAARKASADRRRRRDGVVGNAARRRKGRCRHRRLIGSKTR